MTWVYLHDNEVEIIKRGLDREVGFHLASSHKEETLAAQNLRDRIKERTKPNPQAALYYELATDFDGPYRLSDPDEFENPPFVSQSDEGAHVMAWIWVDKPNEVDSEE